MKVCARVAVNAHLSARKILLKWWKINFVATATKDVLEKGVHAGNIVKEVAQTAGGKGGGRPNMAQAGAPDVTKVDEALAHAKEVLKSQVK